MLFLVGLDPAGSIHCAVFLIWKIRVLARVSGLFGRTEISFCALCEDKPTCLSLAATALSRQVLFTMGSQPCGGRTMHSRQ